MNPSRLAIIASVFLPAARQRTRRSLPDQVRQQFMQGMQRPAAAGKGGGGQPRSSERGGLMPQLSANESGHAFAVKVISPEGRVLATWPLTGGLEPKMIDAANDGTVYVAGGGKLAAFGEGGN